MIEVLIRARPIVFTFFLCAFALTVIGSALDIDVLYIASGIISHITLLLILAPYSFGTLSDRRYIIKIMARLCFAVLILTTGNIIFYLAVGFML